MHSPSLAPTTASPRIRASAPVSVALAFVISASRAGRPESTESMRWRLGRMYAAAARRWRTSAFCESARQQVGVGSTQPALAFAQQESSRPPRPDECSATEACARRREGRRMLCARCERPRRRPCRSDETREPDKRDPLIPSARCKAPGWRKGERRPPRGRRSGAWQTERQPKEHGIAAGCDAEQIGDGDRSPARLAPTPKDSPRPVRGGHQHRWLSVAVSARSGSAAVWPLDACLGPEAGVPFTILS